MADAHWIASAPFAFQARPYLCPYWCANVRGYRSRRLLKDTKPRAFLCRSYPIEYAPPHKNIQIQVSSYLPGLPRVHYATLSTFSKGTFPHLALGNLFYPAQPQHSRCNAIAGVRVALLLPRGLTLGQVKR